MVLVGHGSGACIREFVGRGAIGTKAWRRKPIKGLLIEGALGKDPKALQRNP